MKVDDSVYLSPQRLALATQQWLGMGAEYVGCMKRGVNIPERYNLRRGFEKDYMLMGEAHLLNAHRAAFALSTVVIEEALLPNAHQMRHLSSEGAVTYA
jgi:hypothetical protein